MGRGGEGRRRRGRGGGGGGVPAPGPGPHDLQAGATPSATAAAGPAAETDTLGAGRLQALASPTNASSSSASTHRRHRQRRLQLQLSHPHPHPPPSRPQHQHQYQHQHLHPHRHQPRRLGLCGQGRDVSELRRPSPPRGPAGPPPSSSAAAITTSAGATPAPVSSSQAAAAAALLGSMEPSPLSFWGPDPVPLPARFARIKRALVAGHEADLEACWARLVAALRAEVEHVECLGPHLIPSVEFADLDDPAQTARFGRDLRRYGVGVVRKVLPRGAAEAAVRDTVAYLDGRRRPRSPPGTAGAAAGTRAAAAGATATPFRASRQDPTCFDCFWTPAQVRARAHPNVLRTQAFMMSLWGCGADGDDGRSGRPARPMPITYVDRIRVHGGGFDTSSSGSSSNRNSSSGPNSSNSNSTPAPPAPSSYAWPHPPTQPHPQYQQQHQQQYQHQHHQQQHQQHQQHQQQHSDPSQFLGPQSADDWINALQSSAGIIAQVDNGSLERWEPDGYGRGGTYDAIFRGRWEAHDPWECTGRVHATMDLYNGYGACTIYRMFQGLLALSTIEPGMLRLLPSPHLATAYYLLRPFFSPRRPAPAARSGPEWEAYLDPANWELQRDPDTIIHGAVPGHAQRVTERWHPHLCLRRSLVTLPTLQPGDYIFWHPDLPYHISSHGGHGMGTPSSRGVDDISMLVYIPAAPLTQTNALYLARQRKAFQRGHPGPDFDSSGRGVVAEDPDVRPGEAEIADVGGTAGLRAMGLAPWKVGSQGATAAEDEVIQLANLILFPE